MDSDLRWVIGIAISVCLFVATTLIATFRVVATKIARTHERIDDVKEKYVRRDDLDIRLAPINQQLTEMRAEMRDQNEKVLQSNEKVLSALAKSRD